MVEETEPAWAALAFENVPIVHGPLTPEDVSLLNPEQQD